MELIGQGRRNIMHALQFSPAERFLFALAVVAELLAFASSQLLNRSVDWPPFLSSYLAALGFVIIGAYIRTSKGKPRLALALQGVGLVMAFGSAFSVFIFTLLPLPNPMVDPFLTETGHWFGYDWRAFVATMMDYPVTSRALSYVYQSSLPQMMLTVGLLSYYHRSLALYRFVFVGMLTLVITLGIWWRWPSVGYVGALPYSRDELAEIGFRVGTNYGELLTRLLQEGVEPISVRVVRGVVGFPSYHMVMALMVVWYCRQTFLFLPILVVNLAMIPATLLHGGHHLVDLLGGLVVFGFSVLVANWLIREGRIGGPRGG